MRLNKKQRAKAHKRIIAEAKRRMKMNPFEWDTIGLCERFHSPRQYVLMWDIPVLYNTDREVIKEYFKPTDQERRSYKHCKAYWLQHRSASLKRRKDLWFEGHEFRILVLLMAAELVLTLKTKTRK